MALFVLLKLILQTCTHSHPVGLDVGFLVGPFIYFHTLCVRTTKALARLRRCAVSLEPSLFTYAVSTIISWAGSFYFCKFYLPAFVIVNLFTKIRPTLKICLFAVYWPRIFRLGRLVGNNFFFVPCPRKKHYFKAKLLFFFKNAKHIYGVGGKLVIHSVNCNPKYFQGWPYAYNIHANILWKFWICETISKKITFLYIITNQQLLS